MSKTSLPLRDRELMEMLGDDPELLAIADALVQTWAETQGREAAGRIVRRRVLLVAAVVSSVALAAIAVAVSGLVGSSRPGSRPHPGRGIPMAFHPLTLDFARNAGAVTAIAITVNAPIRDASLEIHVLRSSASQPLQAMQNQADAQVVYKGQLPMTNIASPVSGPPGTVALSTWSGTLSTSDWDGGCQHALYTVEAVAVPVGSSFETPLPDGSQVVTAQWFTCSSQ
jgi:hypothetical protein